MEETFNCVLQCPSYGNLVKYSHLIIPKYCNVPIITTNLFKNNATDKNDSSNFYIYSNYEKIYTDT